MPVIIRVIFITALFSLSLYSTASETNIVVNGKAQAEIIISQNPERTVPIAAEEFQTYIEKISGAKLPIVTSPSANYDVKIYIGSSTYTDNLGITDEGLRYDAYRMVTGENWLVLLGQDDNFDPPDPYGSGISYHGLSESELYAQWDAITGEKWGNPYNKLGEHYDPDLGIWSFDGRGTLNAVYDFLRGLGVRWYFPGEIGECIPEMKNISFSGMNRSERPDFKLRQMYQYYQQFFRASEEEIKWQLRLGLNSGRESIGMTRGHGINYVLTRDEMKSSHPDYYALWWGERQIDGLKPCLSTEGLRSQNKEFVRAMYDHYDDPMVNVSPADGYGYICNCNKCQGKDTPERGWEGKLSDYVWNYVEEVAREVYQTHPDKKINGLAYTTYALPPSQIDTFPPNLTVTFCRWRTWMLNESTKQKWTDLRNNWLEKLPSKEVYYWDYYLHNRSHEHFNEAWQGVPVYFPHLIKENLAALKGLSGGEYIEVYRNWKGWNYDWHALATMHLNMYVTARMWWDADQNVDEMLREYYNKFYGPAAEEMKRFVEYSEANWKSAREDNALWDEMRKLLSAAIDEAGENNIYRERIQMIDDFMKVHANNTDGAETSYHFSEEVNLCQGDTLLWHGEEYFTSGIYYDSLTTVSGADSIYELNLEVNQVNTGVQKSDSTLTAKASSGYYSWIDCEEQMKIKGEDDQSFSPEESGHYALVMQQDGCVDTSSCYYVSRDDSKSYFYRDNEYICQGETVQWHGEDYSSSGVYYDSLTSINGADSVYQLKLTVNSRFFFNQETEICQGDVYSWHGKDFTKSGTYYDSLLTVHGCDSIYELNVNLNRVDTTVEMSNNVLTARATTGNYSWMDCESHQLVDDADQRSFSPDVSGLYALVIEQSGCTDTSSCYGVELQDTRVAGEPHSKIHIYPNPVSDMLTIEGEQLQRVSIYNTKGQILNMKEFYNTGKVNLPMTDYPQAPYILHIKTALNRYTRLIIVE